MTDELTRAEDVKLIVDNGTVTLWDGTPEGYLHYIPP